MGYRFSYLLLRALHHARQDKAALAMLSSYLYAAVRRDARYSDAEVRAYLRHKQTLRALARRYVESRQVHA